MFGIDGDPFVESGSRNTEEFPFDFSDFARYPALLAFRVYLQDAIHIDLDRFVPGHTAMFNDHPIAINRQNNENIALTCSPAGR